MTQYGFHINQSLCSGCCACQMACKDLKNTNDERNFRRVTETVVGSFVPSGAGYANDVAAFYTSMGCNHCDNAACMTMCPVGARTKDSETGATLIDEELCIGCKSCFTACPYGAPQYHVEAGKMTGCDMCRDLVLKGDGPACVDACPLEALDFGPIDELRAKYGDVVETSGLPTAETEPNIVITPHRGALA